MSTLTTGLQYYEAGERAYAQGFYLDAQAAFERACLLCPHNEQYQSARNRLPLMTFQFFKKNQKVASSDHDLMCACGECCCEICGEGCCECICEGIGEGCG